jgi:alpha-glucuronidase
MGEYDIAVQYYDLWGGVSHYDLLVNGKSVAKWAADDTLPPAQPDRNLDGQDSTRFTVRGVLLQPRDTLELLGTPDQQSDLPELAPVDYIEIGPNGSITPQ